MASIGENFSDDEIAGLMELADVNKDGKIDFDEFVNLVK
jgi:Ca2+-binding EF-hand superfamily protein